MNCSWMQSRLARYLSGELSWFERLAARAHLRLCDECFDEYERRDGAADWTSRIMPVRVPGRLEISTRLALSRELAVVGGMRGWIERAGERTRSMLGPLAIRSAGVLASSLLLFGILMPDIWKAHETIPNDVPLTYMANALFTAPSIEVMGPYALKQDATVLAFVDMRGGVYDIELPDDLANNVRLRAELTNALLFTEFHPATRFGRPVAGQILIHFTRTTVRG